MSDDECDYLLQLSVPAAESTDRSSRQAEELVGGGQTLRTHVALSGNQTISYQQSSAPAPVQSTDAERHPYSVANSYHAGKMESLHSPSSWTNEDQQHPSEEQVLQKQTTHRTRLQQTCRCLPVLLIILSFMLAAAAVILEFQPSTKQLQILIIDNDTVLLNKANSFWYNKVTVRQLDVSNDHLLYLYSINCKNLTVHNETIRKRSQVLPAKEPIIVFTKYLLQGSHIMLNITVLNASTTRTAAELYIFDDLSELGDFREGKVGRKQSVAHAIVKTEGPEHITTLIEFTAPKRSYYFGGITFTDSITAEYEYELQLLFYDRHDYVQDCVVEDTNVCSFSLQSGFLPDQGENCLLGYAYRPIQFSENPYSINVTLHRNHFNIVLVCLFTALAITMALFVLWVCCCCFKRRTRAQYDSL